MVRSAMIGARVRRKEDPRLITGTSTYVDDIQLHGTVRLVFVRSPHAHANIRSIDTSAAKAAPGVLAVYTSEEFEAICGPMPGGGTGEGAPSEESEGGHEEGQENIPTPTVWPLARDTVRYVGEPVVAVVALSEAQGYDAAEMVDVEYEVLPAIIDVEAAMAQDAQRIWAGISRNIATKFEKTVGDPDGAFSSAAHTIKQRIRSQRVVPMAMEGRAVLAAPDPLTHGLTVWTSTQAPHWNRASIAEQFSLSESQVRVIAPEVGGGFGAKIAVYREEMMVAALSLAMKRPVKWIESRSENILGTNHGRCQLADIELAADADGKITGIRLTVIGDAGAFPMGTDMPATTVFMALGCYDIPNIAVQSYAVYTTTMAIGAYRGAGRPEAAYYIERAMDILAQKVGVDPTELRRRNFIQPDNFPYHAPQGPFTYDTGEYEKALDKAIEVSAYAQLRKEQEQARAEGKLMGIGVASYVEICGFGPFDSATVRVEPSGAVSVFTGISPHGQGQETTFAQMIADDLGVDFDQVTVHHGDTSNTPQGNGTMGSRGLVVGGSAVYMATRKVRDKALAIAGHLMEVAAGDVEYRDGQYFVTGAPDKALTLKEIAAAAYSGNVPEGVDPGLVSTDFFKTPGETYPFGTHVAVVDITPETGAVHVRDLFTVDDCGNVMSPILVDGQVHGGLAQGIGQALYEEAIYDEDGQLLTATLMDYALPHADHFPTFTLNRTVTTTPLNPLGAKGIGEAATIGATPSVVNAVLDALAPLGITHLDMPLTSSKVWNALQTTSMAASSAEAAD